MERIVATCVYEQMCECDHEHGIYVEDIMNELIDENAYLYDEDNWDSDYCYTFKEMYEQGILIAYIRKIVTEDDDYYWESTDNSIWHASEE